MFFYYYLNLVCKHGERERERERIILVRNDLKQWSEKQKCMVKEEYEERRRRDRGKKKI